MDYSTKCVVDVESPEALYNKLEESKKYIESAMLIIYHNDQAVDLEKNGYQTVKKYSKVSKTQFNGEMSSYYEHEIGLH